MPVTWGRVLAGPVGDIVAPDPGGADPERLVREDAHDQRSNVGDLPIGPARGPRRPEPRHPFAGRPYAEETQRAVDTEVRATAVLRAYLSTLSHVVELLLEREAVDGSDLAGGRSSHHRRARGPRCAPCGEGLPKPPVQVDGYQTSGTGKQEKEKSTP